jgi:hypothetical protein
MKIIINGEAKNMTYEDICHKLSIVPDVHFVEVNKAGTIDFTIGKPDEINYLIGMVNNAGMQLSARFKKWIGNNGQF